MARLGASILLITGLLCGGLFLWLDHRKYEVLSVPFPLLVGQHSHGQLKPEMTGQYEITINTAKSDDFKRQLCLLGVSLLNPPECDPTLSVIQMRWQIALGNRLVGEGASDYLNWNVLRNRAGAEGRLIGDANLNAGSIYDLDITSEKDGAPLAKLNPTLQVRVSNLVSMGDGDIAVVVAIPALIALLTGMVVFVLGAFEWLNRKSYRLFWCGK